MVAGSHHLHEEQDMDPHRIEKSDPDRHKSDADPQLWSGHALNNTETDSPYEILSYKMAKKSF